jgi:putative ATP-dependent endonuclease of OLD family
MDGVPGRELSWHNPRYVCNLIRDPLESNMRIETVVVKNLRCIKETIAHLDPYTCFVGPNGAGKSTLLCALNIFFRNTEAATNMLRLSVEDFHHQVTDAPIEVTVTFTDLGPKAEADFGGYVRFGKLTVSAVAHYDAQAKCAEVIQYGERLAMPDFAPFFKKYGDKAKAGDLRPVYEALKNSKYPELPSWRSVEGAVSELRAYEAARPDECQLLRSQDQFYGATKGAGLLDKYLQWVYIPAVKDASDEEAEHRDSALGKLLARTVRKKIDFETIVEAILSNARTAYEQMLEANQPILSDLSAALSARLREWAHPEATLTLEWQQDSSKAVKAEMPLANVIAGESNFKGKLARFGHGFQRSFLLALLQELAYGEDAEAPLLILACEEPELYQHPPQARYLASVFEKLSKNNSQVIVTTHSPYFVSGRNFESVRLVHRVVQENCSKVEQFSYQKLAEKYSSVTGDTLRGASAVLVKVHQMLQPTLNEMFFTQRLILVEGLEDVAYLQTWMMLTDRWEVFRQNGSHIVPCSGKSELIRPAIIAEGLGIPNVAIFDCDGSELGKNHEKLHIRDNVALLKLYGGSADPFPSQIVWGDRFVCWPENIGETVSAELRATLGEVDFDLIRSEVSAEFDHAGRLDKTALYIGTLLTIAQQRGAQSPSLDRVCDWINTFGSSS